MAEMRGNLPDAETRRLAYHQWTRQVMVELIVSALYR
jgi:hypothetical protein